MIAIGYVHPGWVTHEFMHSMMNLKTRAIVIPKRSGPLISAPRNEVVAFFLDETEATHLLFVDTDIRFDPSVPGRLLDARKPIVSAFYRGRDGDDVFCVAVRRRPDGHFDRKLTLEPNTGVTRVDGVGMGCCLIERRVLEALPLGILRPFYEGPWDKTDRVGEDIMFCLQAQEAGFQSWLDTTTVVGHVKTEVI